tara:strand:+ start:6397 stop:7350 length:954 start_codon:yes stop_codon:yes gene_type:complete
MENNLKKPKYIIVLGTTFSGSGAIFDYLRGRGDLYNPLVDQEYALPRLPNGFMFLEAITGKAFDPAITEYALIQFKFIADQLMNYWIKKTNDDNLKKQIPFFKKKIDQFIEDISFSDFPMRLFWRELMETPSQYIFDRLKTRIGFRNKDAKSRLIVSQKDLICAAQELHDNMFYLNSNDCPVLLNQSGSGWNPTESTKYFTEKKIVLVTRDPRDQFAELKQFKKAGSIEGFIKWYGEMQRRLKLINDPNILIIRFEDFVMNNKISIKKLCEHISISPNIESTYQPNLSKKNIRKFSNLILQNEIEKIERVFKEHTYN